MALFLVLEDFAAGTSTASAGSLLDSTAVDLAPLQAAGLAIVAYNPATMAAPREAFLAARGSRPSVPDTAGDLSALLLAAGAIGGSGGGVTSVSASVPLASSGGATPTISLTAGASSGDVLTWNGAAWAGAAPATTGITELTGDVVGGPGTGSVAVTVAGIQGTPVNATPPQPGFTLSFDGVEWVPAIEGFAYFFGSALTQDPAQNVYSVWGDMLASIALQPTGVVPVITVVGLETVPAGTWDLRRGILRSPELVTGLSRLIVPTGATLDNVAQLDYGLVVECQPTIAGESLTFSATPGIHALVIGLSSVLVNSGSAPAWVSPGGGTTCILASNGVPWAAEPAPTAPLISVGAGDTLLAVMPVSLDPWPAGWAAGTLTSALQYFVQTSGELPSLPLWLGSIGTARQQVVYAAEATLYADSVSPLVPVASGGTHVCVRGDEFVRVAPTGTGAITVTLPDPATTTGRTITVKKTTTDVIDAINVVPTAGLIDGAASYPLPASAYSVLSFTSDGTDYWVV
jgi:hypothetical protein